MALRCCAFTVAALGSAALAAYPPYNGFFDTLGRGTPAVVARGWAYEPALGGAPSLVVVLANGTVVYEILANASRPDIVPNGAPDPAHGFELDMTAFVSSGNTRVDIFMLPQGAASWSLNNSPRFSDSTSAGLPLLRGMQGMDDATMTSTLEANGDVTGLDVRYAVMNATLQPGLRRYNLFWTSLEPSESPQRGGANPSLPCPPTQVRVPHNESDRLARGYHNYHCYDSDFIAQFDDMLTRDAAIGAASALIVYGSPGYAIHPNCTGFPWGNVSFNLGCYPWNNLDDWEDYMNFMAERWSAPAGSGRARVSSYVLWNEVQSMGWGDPSPVLPNRYAGENYTEAQMDVLTGMYADMILRADAAVRRHTRGVMLAISFDHFMEPPPLKVGDVMHVGGNEFLASLWPKLNASLIDWSVAVHPYDNGDPRQDMSSIGVYTFATLEKMVADVQCAFLGSVARIPPQGCAVQPQVRMYASEQGWVFNNKTMNDTLRARNICWAHNLSLAQGVWAVTHNYFQPSAPNQGQGGDNIFGLVPPPPIVWGNLTNGVGYPTFDAYVATSPSAWGQPDNYCCVHWGVGCGSARQ